MTNKKPFVVLNAGTIAAKWVKRFFVLTLFQSRQTFLYNMPTFVKYVFFYWTLTSIQIQLEMDSQIYDPMPNGGAPWNILSQEIFLLVSGQNLALEFDTRDHVLTLYYAVCHDGFIISVLNFNLAFCSLYLYIQIP